MTCKNCGMQPYDCDCYVHCDNTTPAEQPVIATAKFPEATECVMVTTQEQSDELFGKNRFHVGPSLYSVESIYSQALAICSRLVTCSDNGFDTAELHGIVEDARGLA